MAISAPYAVTSSQHSSLFHSCKYLRLPTSFLGPWLVLAAAELFEEIAFLAIATKLITYLTRQLHEGIPTSFIDVYNSQISASFFLAISGGFIADTSWGRFWPMLKFSLSFLLVSKSKLLFLLVLFFSLLIPVYFTSSHVSTSWQVKNINFPFSFLFSCIPGTSQYRLLLFRKSKIQIFNAVMLSTLLHVQPLFLSNRYHMSIT